MKAIEVIKSKKQVFAVIGIVIAAIIFVFAAGMAVFYSGQAEAGGFGSEKAVGFILEHTADSIEPSTAEEGEAQEEQEEITEAMGTAASGDHSAEEQSDAASDMSESGTSGGQIINSGNPSGSKVSQTAPSKPSPQKKWVEDTEQVWVEDRAAWTESVPIYSSKELSICNVCGTDITGNTSAHAKAHMMAGEGSGHHNEVRKTVSGYNTVNHPAEGHYETKVVGGHWE